MPDDDPEDRMAEIMRAAIQRRIDTPFDPVQDRLDWERLVEAPARNYSRKANEIDGETLRDRRFGLYDG